jgi:hypothetical protein
MSKHGYNVRNMLCSLFFSYGNENTKKVTLTVDFPLKMWLVWMLQNIFILCYALKIPLLDAFLNYGTNTLLKNENPSPPSSLIFNIA